MPAVSPDRSSADESTPAEAVTEETPPNRPHPDSAETHVHTPGRTTPAPAPARDQQTLVAAGELLRALAAPVRIAIVLQLRSDSRCVHELVEALGVTQPLISQHLRVLKSAGVVHGERHGREVVYRLVDDHLAHIVVDAVLHSEETMQAADGALQPTVAASEQDGARGTEAP